MVPSAPGSRLVMPGPDWSTRVAMIVMLCTALTALAPLPGRAAPAADSAEPLFAS
jgi:hypothetical protein